MTKLIPSRMFALAIVAAIAVGLATPASAMTYNRNGAEGGDLVFLPGDSNCGGHYARCDLVRY
jgi:hypothetical protein